MDMSWRLARQTDTTTMNIMIGVSGDTLRHWATSRKVAGSIPDGIIGIFHSDNPFGRNYGPGVDSASHIN